MADAQSPESLSEGSLIGAPPALDWDATVDRRGRLRLRTLVLLRWLGVAGQTIALLFTALVLHFPVPFGWCALVILASVYLNVLLSFTLPTRRLARDWEAAAQLGFDVVQLAVLLALPAAWWLRDSAFAGSLSTKFSGRKICVKVG